MLYLQERCYTQNKGVVLETKGVIPENEVVVFKIKV